MNSGMHLDNRLLRALREGVGVLPEDLGHLVDCLRLIDGLLREKAAEHEPSWALAVANAAEIETLQALESAVAERAIMLRADTLEAVLLKLEIWHALGPGAEEPEETAERASPRDRLVLSIEADLVRLARGRQA